MKKLNNKGFTLVELIVVIAILGVLAGAMSYSINQIFSNRIRKFANEYDAMLTRCRVETLCGSPAPTKVKLWLDADGHYYAALYQKGEETEREKLGDSNVTCTYTAGAVSGTIDASHDLDLAFDRSTGALDSHYPQVTEIDISGVKITVVPSTGYHKVGG